jgi:hypothetical protein
MSFARPGHINEKRFFMSAYSPQQPARFAWLLIIVSIARTLARGPQSNPGLEIRTWQRLEFRVLPAEPRALDRLFTNAEAQLGMVR